MEQNQLNKKFIKDYQLPIEIHFEPYFSYFLEEFDEFLGCKKKYEKFLENHNKVVFSKDEHSSFSNYVLEFVKKNPHFIEFNSSDFSNFSNFPKLKNVRTDIYKNELSGHTFISIDLVKANFYSLYDFNPLIFENISNYEEWIKTFPNGHKYADVKSIRQFLFGNLNPKRQQTLQKSFMHSLIEHLVEERYFGDPQDNDIIYLMGSDEFLIDVSTVPDVSLFKDDLNKTINDYLETVGSKFLIKTESFVLKKNEPFSEFGFSKIKEDGSIEFKGVEKRFFPQLIKTIKGKPLNEMDLMFLNEQKILSKMSYSLFDRENFFNKKTLL